jgi:Domain of unknown function (DUF397)
MRPAPSRRATWTAIAPALPALNAGLLVIAVRDSKDPNGPALTFTAPELRTLLTLIKTGRLGPA